MSQQDEITNNDMLWTPQIEKMLARWCDQAKCFEWMHGEAYSMFDKRSKAVMLTSNILTAISGLSNVIVGGESIDGFKMAWVFGGLSIAISITNMLQEKLGYVTRAANHNHLCSQWGIIRRKIEEEIGIPAASRKDCRTFLKYIRLDINQASIDGNTIIPKSIRERCYDKFKTIPDFDIPDICGQLEHTKIYVEVVGESLSEPFLGGQVSKN